MVEATGKSEARLLRQMAQEVGSGAKPCVGHRFPVFFNSWHDCGTIRGCTYCLYYCVCVCVCIVHCHRLWKDFQLLWFVLSLSAVDQTTADIVLAPSRQNKAMGIAAHVNQTRTQAWYIPERIKLMRTMHKTTYTRTRRYRFCPVVAYDSTAHTSPFMDAIRSMYEFIWYWYNLNHKLSVHLPTKSDTLTT